MLCVCLFFCFVFASHTIDLMKNIQYLDNETYNELLIILAPMCTMRCKKINTHILPILVCSVVYIYN